MKRIITIIIIIIIVQRLARHVSVIRMTNRRRVVSLTAEVYSNLATAASLLRDAPAAWYCLRHVREDSGRQD